MQIKKNVKVKQPHYRPGQAQRVPGGWGSQISRQSAHESGKVVSLTHRPPLSPRKYSWYSFLLEAESAPRDIVLSEGLRQWKIPMTPSGIEPVTFKPRLYSPVFLLQFTNRTTLCESRHLVTRATKFLYGETWYFRRNCRTFSLLCKIMRIRSVHMHRAGHGRWQSGSHSRSQIVAPRHWNCFMSLFWSQELGSGDYIFEKLCNPPLQ